jgi:hypothetical protein
VGNLTTSLPRLSKRPIPASRRRRFMPVESCTYDQGVLARRAIAASSPPGGQHCKRGLTSGPSYTRQRAVPTEAAFSCVTEVEQRPQCEEEPHNRNSEPPAILLCHAKAAPEACLRYGDDRLSVSGELRAIARSQPPPHSGTHGLGPAPSTRHDFCERPCAWTRRLPPARL